MPRTREDGTTEGRRGGTEGTEEGKERRGLRTKRAGIAYYQCPPFCYVGGIKSRITNPYPPRPLCPLCLLCVLCGAVPRPRLTTLGFPPPPSHGRGLPSRRQR